MANDLWWVPDMEKDIARIEDAIRGKADHENVRLPLGDARYESVGTLKARAAEKRRAIAEAKAGR